MWKNEAYEESRMYNKEKITAKAAWSYTLDKGRVELTYHVTLAFLLMCFSVVFLMRFRLRLKPNFCFFLSLFSLGILPNKFQYEV